jgi:NDP-sugar pyrophosphorylase family protein
MLSVLLAAGHGSRLRPVLGNKPKFLLEVDGKPLLVHQLNNLQLSGATEVIIVVRPEYKTITDEVLGHAPKNISSTIITRGSSSGFESFCSAGDLVRGQRFILLTIDSIFQKQDLTRFRDQHAVLTDEFLVGSTSYIVDEKPSYVVVDQSLKVINIVRNHNSQFVTAGIYSCPPDFYDYTNQAIAMGINSMTNYLGFYVHQKRPGILFVFPKMIDIDTPEDIRLAEEWLKSEEHH